MVFELLLLARIGRQAGAQVFVVVAADHGAHDGDHHVPPATRVLPDVVDGGLGGRCLHHASGLIWRQAPFALDGLAATDRPALRAVDGQSVGRAAL
jgi:hypothetical protein